MTKNIVGNLLVLVVVGFLLVTAQDSSTVQLTDLEGVGQFLTDGDGMSLYLFANDSKNESACYDQCAENWPPLLVEGEPSAGQGVAASLLGTFERSDGSQQVTYNGLPLYYFANDAAAGDISGQGVGEVWYLVSPYGVAVEVKEEEVSQEQEDDSEEVATAEMDHMVFGALMGEGRQVFATHCAACHGPEGRGGEGVALAGYEKLSNKADVIKQTLHGSRFMPRFAEVLTDREIAAVTTFIRNAWGNEFGPVTEQEVKVAR